jgi:cation diffusion facilitator family transporter
MRSAERHREQAETQRRLLAVRIAIATSLAVCSVELILGYLLHLESLLAEGVHTLLDGLASLVVLLLVYLAAKPADRQHPFGHGKYEALGATIEGSFAFVAAIGIALRAFDKLAHGEAPEDIPLFVCILMGTTAGFYLIVSSYLMREARRTRSPAILAEALHLRTHIYITAGVGGGLLIGLLGDWPAVDAILALGIAVCLFGISVRIFREVLKQFTDAALPKDEIETLGRIIDRFSSRFVEVHGLRTRQAGAERHIDMHLVVAPETTVAEAHTLSHDIEDVIAEEWAAARTIVHIEPFNTADEAPPLKAKSQPNVRTDEVSPNEREFIH